MVKFPPQADEPSILHMLHRVSQHAEQLFAHSIDSTGLTARQLIVLDAVFRLDRPSQSDICAATGIDRSTLADIARRLVGKGMLARRRTKEDARAYAVRLTEVGRQALSRALPAVLAVDQQLLSALPPSERECFTSALRRILETAHHRGNGPNA